MARRLRDATLDSRQARRKLAPRGEPFFRCIERGVHLGYRRRDNAAGTWLLRNYVGGAYRAERIGIADDLSDADGATVLNYWQAVEAVRRRMAERGRSMAAGVREITVAQAADDYLDFLRSDGRTDSAIKDATYRIDAFIRPTIGKDKLATLTAKQLREWRADLAKAPPRLRTRADEKQKHRNGASERARKATANRILTTLKALLNHAFDEEKVASNKAWGRRVKPFEKVETARIRYLKIDEAERLANACAPDFRPMVQAALLTGARYSELTRLQVTDFDADAGTVFIQLSKGGKARHVVLSGEGVTFFRQACAGRSGSDLIFRKPDGGAWLKSHQARPMAAACKAARIKPAIGFHVLRHTYATLAVKRGAPLHAVALNLGHVTKDGQPDVRMVTKHYAHFEKSHVAEMIREHAPRFGFRPDRKVAPLAGRGRT
jgi:integrase